MAKGEFLGDFEQIVLLAVLRLESHAYGVSIREEIERCTGRRVTTGAVYATLARLESKGHVRSWLGEATAVRGGRPKRYIAVTAGGLSALREVREMMKSMLTGVTRRWGIS